MDKNEELSTSTMSLGDHLEELRARLILALLGLAVGTIACLIFGRYLLRFLQRPYYNIGSVPPLVVLAPADAFVGYMKVSFIAGLMLSCPWVFYHIWMFVAAGLYQKEKRYVKIAVPFSAALFVAGAFFFFFVVAPISLRFFLKFGDIIGVTASWTFQKYIAFITTLMLVFGLAFQTPIAIFILNKVELVSIAALKSSRKYVLLAMFIIAAMATPPDVVSQITLAIPLYLLYELGIILCWLSAKKRKNER
ncbi:MAG: twin-arginine translocase subunit TatC [Sedimentisphaerales bacterium]|nr:twin-arginine translocase subunit TatC [Sedimentisphaerales bacterium]